MLFRVQQEGDPDKQDEQGGGAAMEEEAKVVAKDEGTQTRRLGFCSNSLCVRNHKINAQVHTTFKAILARYNISLVAVFPCA